MRFWGDLVCTASALGLEGSVNGGVGAVVGEDERRGRECWLKMAQELPLRQSKHFLFRDVTSEGYRASLRFNALSQPFNHECVLVPSNQKKSKRNDHWKMVVFWLANNQLFRILPLLHFYLPHPCRGLQKQQKTESQFKAFKGFKAASKLKEAIFSKRLISARGQRPT